MFKIFLKLTQAIANEIAIDKEAFQRSEINGFYFVPIRPMKSAKHLSKIPTKTIVYFFLNVIFLLLSPVIFGYQLTYMLIIKLKLKNLKGNPPESTVVLVANSRTIEIFQKNLKAKHVSVFYINFTQDDSINTDAHILQYISPLRIVRCYFLALFYIIINLPMLFKLNLLQCYVSFDWLVKHESLDSIHLDNKKNIYFSNHYDRWAVMFDSVLSTSNLNLLQHGMLPENLALPYKLTNLKSIYTFDLLSQNIFISLFDLSQDVLFYLLESKLCLSKTSYKRSVLIIGQPQSVFYEMEILQYLIKIEDIDMIFIKPHPLYSMEAYKNIKSPKVSVIYDKLYFPEVMVALNFESTLGLEYQKIGIPVISIKDKRKSNVLLEVIEAMKL